MWRYLCLTASMLAGCASHAPAPVVDRQAPTVIEGDASTSASAAPAVPREGYYLVKKGDTLRQIALAHGIEVRDLVAWNALENPNQIEIGQPLRVIPPEGAAVVRPVAAPGQVTVVGEVPKAAGSHAEAVKREPRGGVVAYSDKALAQVRAYDGSVAIAVEEPKAADKPPSSVAPAPAPAPVPAVPAVGMDWAWPAAGKVIHGFAEGGSGQASNKGIDIAGRLGEPVTAAAAGKVTYVGNLRGYGDFVVIRHNAEYISVYAHAGKILVKKDQAVARGQKIAEIGSSDANQPKLHFEVRRQSQPVDPLKVLPARP